MKKDYCIKCHNQMVEIEIGGKLKWCFVCVDKECERFGLMAVVGYKLVKKMDKKEVKKKNARISSKGSQEQHRKKS